MSDLSDLIRKTQPLYNHLTPAEAEVLDELVEALQLANECTQSQIDQANEHFKKMEAEITRATGERDRADEVIAKLIDQLASARKALEPFAALADKTSEKHRDDRPILYGLNTFILENLTIGHLRAAKAALSDEQGK